MTISEIENGLVEDHKSRICRYAVTGCTAKVTHFCSECASGITALGGYYCKDHAERHDRIICETLQQQGVDLKHAGLAEPLTHEHNERL